MATSSGRGRIVNRSELAEFFGVVVNTVDSWVRAGCPVVQKGSRGVPASFNTGDVARWRLDQAREEAGGENIADETALKKRKMQADVNLAELNFAKARGEVAPIREFERFQAAHDAAIRSNVLNVPQRVVTQLLGETNETIFKAKLRAELVLALTEAANAELVLPEDDDEPDDD
jgi:phage terminase Nu1 subunit (DNA packaging protein)